MTNAEKYEQLMDYYLDHFFDSIKFGDSLERAFRDTLVLTHLDNAFRKAGCSNPKAQFKEDD